MAKEKFSDYGALPKEQYNWVVYNAKKEKVGEVKALDYESAFSIATVMDMRPSYVEWDGKMPDFISYKRPIES